MLKRSLIFFMEYNKKVSEKNLTENFSVISLVIDIAVFCLSWLKIQHLDTKSNMYYYIKHNHK